ncbi:MAG: DUF4230 domain-containing protein [Dermatophilaceae bacterium]
MSSTERTRPWVPIVLVAILTLGVAFFLADPLGRLKDAILGSSSGPSASDVTLLEIQRTAQLRAATGTFSVPVDYGTSETGIRQYIPDWIDGDSGIAIYQGSVDALVDLRGLTSADLKTDKTTDTLTITVPPPTLTEPNIDEDKSRVVAQQRGLGTRVDDFFAGAPLEKRQGLDQAAVAALREAATQSSLSETARQNGRDFLVALGHRMGFTNVIVRYADESATPGGNN